MSAAAYSPCTIKFVPNDSRPEKNYVDRTIVELRQNDYADYSLRAIDVANNRKEIFNFQLKQSDMYALGSTSTTADKVYHKDGTYYLLLKKEARDQFHTALKTCFEQMGSSQQESPNSRSKQQSSEANVILEHIHELSEFIRDGKGDRAAERVQQLINKGVRLQPDRSKDLLNKPSFPIKIRIDSLESNIKDFGEELTMEVYPSTKVHELRALFEYTHKFPCQKQFFFVNGHLAHGESNMKELAVKEKTLFILFVIGSNSEIY